ncbi:MAG: hypothetical protein Q7U51_02365 [Methanoregula sp.]|nr:hypothetical protein [Methanoregula sp.]
MTITGVSHRRCAVCFLKGFCEQCPAKSWMENGTLDTPMEYLCDVAHAEAKYLGLLSEGEKVWEVTDGRERVERFATVTGLCRGKFGGLESLMSERRPGGASGCCRNIGVNIGFQNPL